VTYRLLLINCIRIHVKPGFQINRLAKRRTNLKESISRMSSTEQKEISPRPQGFPRLTESNSEKKQKNLAYMAHHIPNKYKRFLQDVMRHCRMGQAKRIQQHSALQSFHFSTQQHLILSDSLLTHNDLFVSVPLYNSWS